MISRYFLKYKGLAYKHSAACDHLKAYEVCRVDVARLYRPFPPLLWHLVGLLVRSTF